MRGDFTEAELRALLKREEGQFHEFKSLWNRSDGGRSSLPRRKVRDWIAEYSAAFANAGGGTLLLGVEDDGRVTGHNYPETVLNEFLDVPEKRLRPALATRSQRFEIEGHEVIVIQVRASPEAIMFKGNGFPYRTGDRVIHEPQEVINQRKQAYRRVGFEARIRPDATLEDLDLELAASFLSRSYRDTRPIEGALETYSLIARRAGGYAVTNAALLLFARPPLTRWHPRAGIRFFRVEGTERRHGRERNVQQLDRLDGPVAQTLPAAQRFLASHIRRSEKLHDLFFREMPEYPDFAWQEALINAVAHRDYNDQGREIEVWLYTDRLEIVSPGELVPPVTLEALRRRQSVHSSRNPVLVRVLVDCDIMREEGEGIPRMFDEMEEQRLQPPDLSIDNVAFRVTLYNEPRFEGPGLAWRHLVDRLGITPSQQRVLLARPEGFTNEHYRQLNDVDRDRAYREIQDLVAQGVVLPAEASGRGAVYRLADELREDREWLGSRLPKVDRYLSGHESLQNADYRDLFDVTRQTAKRELGRLVEEGVLKMRGRKRGARYVAGPVLVREHRREMGGSNDQV